MRIAVIGVGKMGSWLAKEFSKENELIVYDINREKMKKFNHIENIWELSSFEPEILINAVNIERTIETFEDVIEYIPEYCILSDIASIKDKIPEYYKKCGHRYASIHPMFGPNFADLENTEKETVIVIKESEKIAKKFFTQFFKKKGMNVIEFFFEEHDKLMSYSLTLPFSLSIVFSRIIPEFSVPGTTFARHRRIAEKLMGEDEHLMAETLLNKYSLVQIEKIISNLLYMKNIIEKQDKKKMIEYLIKIKKKQMKSESKI